MTIQEQRGFSQRTTAVLNLDHVSICSQFTTLPHVHIVLAQIFGKSPFFAFQNLLTVCELKLSTLNRFNNVAL